MKLRKHARQQTRHISTFQLSLSLQVFTFRLTNRRCGCRRWWRCFLHCCTSIPSVWTTLLRQACAIYESARCESPSSTILATAYSRAVWLRGSRGFLHFFINWAKWCVCDAYIKKKSLVSVYHNPKPSKADKKKENFFCLFLAHPFAVAFSSMVSTDCYAFIC